MSHSRQDLNRIVHGLLGEAADLEWQCVEDDFERDCAAPALAAPWMDEVRDITAVFLLRQR